MPVDFTTPTVAPKPTFPVDPMDLGGEDIALVQSVNDRVVSPAGDWEIVRDLPACRQSVLREAVATPGQFVRRPDWGWGGRDAVLRPMSRALKDDLLVRARRRLDANARVTRVASLTIETFETTNGQGTRIDARVESGGRDARIETVFRPKES